MGSLRDCFREIWAAVEHALKFVGGEAEG